MRILDIPNSPIEKAPDSVQDSRTIKVSDSEISFYRKLGRTDLTVSCLGLGGGGGISSEDTLYAYEQGINYFFFSSDLHHHIYSSMSGALKQLCGKGSRQRDRVVLATVTYIKSPEMALAALLDQFTELGIDYIDVFFWGWIGEQDALSFEKCMQLSPDLRGANSLYARTLERMFNVSEKLKQMGAVRYIGASFHDIALAQQWSQSPLLDVVMVRHNVAHRSAQAQVFNPLDSNDSKRPGVVTFKSTGSHSGPLWDVPSGLPKKAWVPDVPDFYRYSLSQNCVDICLAGWQNRKEVDEAIHVMQRGKLTSKEIAYLNVYGDLHRHRRNPATVPDSVWIYRN